MMICRSACIVALTIVLSGCQSPTVYKDEVGRMAAATATVASSFPSEPALTAEMQGVSSNDAILAVLAGDAIKYKLDCLTQARSATAAYISSLQGGQQEQDTAFAGYAKVTPCAVIAHPAPDAPAPEQPAPSKPKKPAKPAKTDAEKAKADAEKAKAEAQLQAMVQANAAVANAGQPPPAPDCAPHCTVEDFTSQLTAYSTALQAIVSAKTAQDVVKAIGDADKAIDGLFAAAKLPAPASVTSDAIKEIADLAVQEAQYLALRSAVLTFEGNWPKVSDYVARAARVRYALLIEARASKAFYTAVNTQKAVNYKPFYSDGVQRVTLFDILNAKVEDANQPLEDACKADPATALQAFKDANHALALALTDRSRQLESLEASLDTLGKQAAALQKAMSPAKTASK